MKFNRLGQTGLYVSEICLGTMTFSGQNFFGGVIGTLNQKEATALIGRSLEHLVGCSARREHGCGAGCRLGRGARREHRYGVHRGRGLECRQREAQAAAGTAGMWRELRTRGGPGLPWGPSTTLAAGSGTACAAGAARGTGSGARLAARVAWSAGPDALRGVPEFPESTSRFTPPRSRSGPVDSSRLARDIRRQLIPAVPGLL